MAEAVLVGVALGLLVVYHIWLWQRIRYRPMTTAFGLARHTRSRWVALIMAERRDLLGVQTLRNWTMAATFLASTAVLIALGVLSFAASTDRTAEAAHLLPSLGASGPRLLQAKLLALAVGLLFAFFNFTLALRFFNHAGFAVALPPETDPERDAEAVAQGLNRGALHYTLGMRAYYMAVPLALWVFGPELLLAGALGILVVLRGLDRP